MATVAELVARLSADTNSFAKGMQSARREMETTQRAAGGLARESSKGVAAVNKLGAAVATTAAGVSVAAAGALTSLVMVGKEYQITLQKTNAAFKTMLGSAERAQGMVGELMDFASTSPFPRQVFIQATQQLLGFGVAAKSIVPIFKSIQDAVAATGGGANEIRWFTDIFAQIKSEGAASTETLQRLSYLGVDAFKILAKQAGKTANQIREDVTDGMVGADQAIEALTAGLQEKFGGAAANVKDTWLGAMDRVKARWRDMGAALVQPFIDDTGGGAAVKFVNKMADLMTVLKDDVVIPLADRMAEFVETAANGLERLNQADALGWVERAKDLFADNREEIVALSAAAIGLGAAFGKAGLVSLPFIGQIAAFLPIPGALASAFIALTASTEEGREAFVELAESIKDGVGDLLPKILPLLAELAETASDIVPQLVDIAASVADAAFPVFAAGLQTAALAATAFLNVIEPLANVLADHPELVTAIVAAYAAWKIVDLVSKVQAFAGALRALSAAQSAAAMTAPLAAGAQGFAGAGGAAAMSLTAGRTAVAAKAAHLASINRSVSMMGKSAASRGISRLAHSLGGLAARINPVVAGLAVAVGGFISIQNAARESEEAAESFIDTMGGDIPTDSIENATRKAREMKEVMEGIDAGEVDTPDTRNWWQSALDWTGLPTPDRGRSDSRDAAETEFTEARKERIRLINEEIKTLTALQEGWEGVARVDLNEEGLRTLIDIADVEMTGTWQENADAISSAWEAMEGTSEAAIVLAAQYDMTANELRKAVEFTLAHTAAQRENRDAMRRSSEAWMEAANAIRTGTADSGDRATFAAGFAEDINLLLESLDGAGDRIGAAKELMTENLSGLTDAAEAAKNSMVQINEDGAEAFSLDKWFGNLREQNEATQQYVDNLAQLPADLQSIVASMPPDMGAEIADQLVEGGPAKMEEMRAIFAERARLIGSDTVTAITEQMGIMPEITRQFGLDSIAELEQALGTMPGVVNGIVGQTGDDLETTLKTTAIIAGMRSGEIGQNIGEELIRSLHGQEADVKKQIERYNDLMAEGLNPLLNAIGGSDAFHIQGAGGSVRVKADGGITDFYANGGMRENHVAEIAAPGDWRVWAEPETGGEAYIPLALSKRQRSLEIWRQTGRRLGMEHFAVGGFREPSDVPMPPNMDRFGVDNNGVPGIGSTVYAGMLKTRNTVANFVEANAAPALAAGVGYKAMMEALRRRFPGLPLISGFRPGAITATGNPSYHGKGRAVDIPPRMDVFNWIRQNYGNSRELIYSPAGSRQLRNGSNHVYSGVTRAMHFDHIHWAMKNGGILDAMKRYDTGGILGAGNVALNTSGRDELVLPADAASDLASSLDTAAQAAMEWADAVNPQVSADLAGLAEDIAKVAFLASESDRQQTHAAANTIMGSPLGEKELWFRGGDLGATQDWAKNLAATYIELEGAIGAANAEQMLYSDLSAAEFEDAARSMISHANEYREALILLAETQEANRRQAEDAKFEMGEIDNATYIAALQERLAATERYSQDFMAIWRQIDQIVEEADNDVESALDDLNRLLDQRETILERMADSQEDYGRRVADEVEKYNTSILDAETSHYEDMEKEAQRHGERMLEIREEAAREIESAIASRRDALSGTLDVKWHFQDLDELSTEIRRQASSMREWSQGIQALSARGLDMDVMEMLGLTDGPQALPEVKEMLRSDVDELMNLNAAFAEHMAAVDEAVMAEKTNAESALAEEIQSIVADRNDALAELQSEHNQDMLRMQNDFAAEMASLRADHLDRLTQLEEGFLQEQKAMQEELAQIGFDGGREWVQAREEGILSGIPGIIDAVNKVKAAMAELDAAEAAASTTQADREWAQMATLTDAGLSAHDIEALHGVHSEADAWNAMAKLTDQGWSASDIEAAVYDQGGILPPGITMAHNATGHPEYVLTGDQLADIATSDGGGSVSIEQNFYGVTLDEVREEARRGGEEALALIANRKRRRS